jgi:hypothetical protein
MVANLHQKGFPTFLKSMEYPGNWLTFIPHNRMVSMNIKKKTFIESPYSMLEITKLLKSFWGEDLYTTCYVQNRSFTSTMLRKTTYEF